MDLSKTLIEQFDTVTCGEFIGEIAKAIVELIRSEPLTVEPETEQAPLPSVYRSPDIAKITGLPTRLVGELLRYGMIPCCNVEKGPSGLRNKVYQVDRETFDAWYAEHGDVLDKFRGGRRSK